MADFFTPGQEVTLTAGPRNFPVIVDSVGRKYVRVLDRGRDSVYGIKFDRFNGRSVGAAFPERIVTPELLAEESEHKAAVEEFRSLIERGVSVQLDEFTVDALREAAAVLAKGRSRRS
ncbi:hypothetical protein [Gordonia malaquae]|uniref:beta barrel domain-containing protein n=1 Tax=Gordonia malaquae TaxID=410332 RepID=UPI003018AA5C